MTQPLRAPAPRQVLPSACPLDCPDACSLDVQVEDGRVVKIDGNPLDPKSNGRLCARGRRELRGLERLREHPARDFG